MNPQQVLNVYRAFWAGYQKLCLSAGAASKPTNGTTINLDQPRTRNGKIVIGSHIYLKNWRSRGSAPSDRIHILINSLETYDQPDDKISRSSVQVLYSKITGANATPLLAVHYDYELPIQAAHPVFHAQFGMGDFSSPAFQGLGFRSAINAPPKGTVYSSVRIPTPCMNLVSVLLGLAADHIDPKFFDKFLNLVRDSEISRWNAKCDALETSIGGGGVLPSHHWYSNT